ncbi:MAG: hypothetical protein IIC49_07690 [Planctomycetes bacterium]|nr:hypothetical protein [Planctomycetota bacterium]
MSEFTTKAQPVQGVPGVEPLARAGRMLFGGQPDAAAIERLAEQEGVGMLINLRQPQEMEKLGFNEATACESCGVTYVNVPVAMPFSKAEVEQFAKAVESTEANVLVHCATSNRVGAIWAAYLATHKDVPVDEAIEIGRSAGMTKRPLEILVRQIAAP